VPQAADTFYVVLRCDRLRVGETYEQGAFGLHLDEDDPQLFREQVLEDVRTEDFPHLPSRLHALFAWPSTDDARGWLSELDDQQSRCIFAVRAEPDSSVFVGDMAWLAHTVTSLDEWDERAEGYWSGRPRFAESRWEVLIEGRITVHAIIDVPLGPN
jgi:hypothetical protein